MVLALGLALALGAGTVQPGADERPDAVTLDVVVEDSRGRPVDSLTSADFAVTERGVPLTVASAHFVRATGSAGASPAPAPAASPLDEKWQVSADTRIIGIFLDEFHVTPGGGTDAARHALERFIREDLGPRDLVAVLKPLDSLLTIRLTRDREAVANEIEAFVARRGDYVPRSYFERNFIAASPGGVDLARAQIAASSLNALVRYLGQFSPSRKTVIVLSEVLAQRSGRAAEWLPGFETIVRTANRGHVSIYPIDPLSAGGLGWQSQLSVAPRSDETQMREALRALATETNGRAILSVNDVDRDLRRTLADASGFYVLTVSRSHADEAFHPVDVSVQRPGLAVLARKGYWALSDDRETPLSKSSAARLSASIARHSSPLIRSWFGMAPATGGVTRINFVWEPAPRVPGDRGNPSTPAQVDLLVTTLDGTTVFDGVILPAGGGSPVPSAAAQSRASFEIPAGRALLVQMAIQDSSSRVVDRDVRDLAVPAFPGPVALGSAEFFRARNAREYHALAADPDSVPVAAREFSRAERLLVRIPVVSDRLPAVVSARLVTRFGVAMRQLPTSRAADADVYQVDVPLAGLPTGGYILEVTAKTAEAQVSDSLSFRVTP